jgi:hypothetical protein
MTNSVASAWLVPLGKTPDYLDPQSQEALHEVDVSGMALQFSFSQQQSGQSSRAGNEGLGSDR